MRSSVLLVGLCVAVSVLVVPSEGYNNTAEWRAYKLQHGKTYESTQIDALRMEIYNRNKLDIEKFNLEKAAEAGFTLGLNQLSDWTEAEVGSLNGFKLSSSMPTNSPEAQKFLDDILNDDSIVVPDELDWRKTPGRVSRVKNQGQCGSCWAFSATGALEGQEKVRRLINNSISEGLIELSEQNLVDCARGTFGCEGGFTNNAIDYARDGIDGEQSYPYEARYGGCRFNRNKVVFKDSGSASLPVGDEQRLKQTVAKYGPVSVAIHVNSLFGSYKTGVFYDEGCSANQLNHAVLVVGYGTDSKQGDYWLVKNSWATTWGEEGYIRMARNRGNNCGIASYAIVPVFRS